MKQTLFGLLVIAGIVGLLVWGSMVQKPVTAGGSQTPVLTSSESLYDFGTISMKNGNVSYTFTLTNPTDSAVRITNVSTSCMCTVAYVGTGESRKGPFGMPGHGGGSTGTSVVVPAQGSVTLEVVYNPNAHGPAGVGAIDRFVYVTDANGATLPIEIKAQVTP